MPSGRAQQVLGFIAGNVRRTRLRRGLTQEQLAEKSELDVRFVQRVERAQTNVSVAVLVALADALELPPGSLFKKASVPPARRGRPPIRRKRGA